MCLPGSHNILFHYSRARGPHVLHERRFSSEISGSHVMFSCNFSIETEARFDVCFLELQMRHFCSTDIYKRGREIAALDACPKC